MIEETPLKLEEITFDKDKFDAVLRRIAATKPLPLKDLTGTVTRSQAKRKSADPEREGGD